MTPGDLPIFDQTDQGIKLIEEERRRIARDLHDGPAQGITNISMRLDVVRRLMERDPVLANEELDRLHQRVRGVVNDIRKLIYDLRPLAIDEVGLIQAARQLCERNQEDWGIPVQVTVSEALQLDMPPARQVAIYRLIQELLNNVRKHAEASHVGVTFVQVENALVVEVVDDGKGFDVHHIPSGHFGIIGLKERVAYLSGKVDIESEIGRGSRFVITIPLAL